MVQQNKWRIFIPTSLDVMQENTPSDIWEFQCTIDNFLIQNGVKLKNVLRKSYLVGKLSNYLMEAV